MKPNKIEAIWRSSDKHCLHFSNLFCHLDNNVAMMQNVLSFFIYSEEIQAIKSPMYHGIQKLAL